VTPSAWIRARLSRGWKLWSIPPRWLQDSLPGIGLFFVLLLPYLTFPLLWDGRWYFNCMSNAAHAPFRFQNFLCFQHPSFLFMGIFAIPEHFFPGSLPWLHGIVLTWGFLSIVAFSAICQKLLPHAPPLTRILATLLYATQPVIVANATAFSPDIGITYSQVILLGFLLYDRTGWIIAAGILLTFTKETGILFYTLAILAHWIFLVRPRFRSTFAALRASWRRIPLLLLPQVLFVVYSASGIAFFEGNDTGSLLRKLTSFSLLEPRFLLTLKEIFLFQFTWLQTGVIAIAALVWLWQWGRGALRPPAQDTRLVWLLAALYAAGAYCLTRYLHVNNLRYFMAIFPIGLLLFAASAVHLLSRGNLANHLLMVALLLQTASLFYSADPLSRAMFGTFSFGERTMYPLGKVDGGIGRDQLVYNLQHLELATIQDAIFAHIRPTPETTISTHRDAWFGFNDGVDPATFRRTLAAGAVMPHYLAAGDIISLPHPPREVWYIEYPNFVNEHELSTLRERYDTAHVWEFRDGGYGIRVHQFRLKPQA